MFDYLHIQDQIAAHQRRAAEYNDLIAQLAFALQKRVEVIRPHVENYHRGSTDTPNNDLRNLLTQAGQGYDEPWYAHLRVVDQCESDAE